MKKFLTTLLIYLLIVGSITGAVNAAYCAMDKSDDDFTRKFQIVPEKIDLCNFGSSHALFGFNYQDVEDRTTFNFALSAQTLSYDLRLMQAYRDHLAEGGTVFITVSYFSLYGIDETESETFEAKNRRYYEFLPWRYIKEFRPELLIRERYLPSLSQGTGLLEVFQGKRVYLNEIQWQQTADQLGDLSADAWGAAQRHLFDEKLDASGRRIRNQEEIDALYGLIRLCRENQMEPILVTTPYLAEYLHAVAEQDPAFLEEFHALMAEITGNTGVRWYDYAADGRFLYDYSLFMNSDHMNRAGARKFTDLLMEEALGFDTGEQK